ncbi:flagellar biosynthesis protein FlgI [Acidihalobacter yilgarnensis]|uniref:Flagellar P-ring protein n=2 Tax=Acidihalobacter yilgarnensis TaxID=2819280 RepID=A0A1D8IPU1_9GAMM|nr:flagellar biosynthesis protein FlgI [Acidihalobacter yilgarnensis]
MCARIQSQSCRRLFALVAVFSLCFGMVGVARAELVRDLATLAGVRSNQLVGYGLVVGLDGTGDQTSQAPFTIQSIENMLTRFGVTLPSNVNPQLNNVAAVLVTANLPPFSKPGQDIDITVSSIGNAKSLRGGTLVMTPLHGANGQVYAMAQGNLVVGGYGAQGGSGSSVQVNVLSVGMVPNGATVERDVPTSFDRGNSITLDLNNPSYTTATRLAHAINEAMGPGTAEALDAASVRVNAPPDRGQRVAFVSYLENINIHPAAPPARVVVNARTGTVIIGSSVRVLPSAVAHGNLTVTISENPQVSQPNALSGGNTVVTPNSTVSAKQAKAHAFVFKPGVTLNSIVKAINRVGATPDDLIAILEALKRAGALRAQLVVI